MGKTVMLAMVECKAKRVVKELGVKYGVGRSLRVIVRGNQKRIRLILLFGGQCIFIGTIANASSSFPFVGMMWEQMQEALAIYLSGNAVA